MSLEDYGWNRYFEDGFETLAEAGEVPARVVLSAGSSYGLHYSGGEITALLSGRLRHDATRASALPAVGDWVGLSTSSKRILHVLPRRSKLSRKVSGKRTEEQVVAANVDQVLVVMGLDSDYSLRRLERYLTTVWESGASPIVLLNKSDCAQDPEARRSEAMEAAPGVPILVASSVQAEGIEDVREHIRPRETAVLVGSSGVGKSTLINRLLGGPVQTTREVRESDGRGQHTTSHRELFVLPGGGLMVDSPGIRELQLWSDEGSLDRAFEDIASVATSCRFHDCSHETEPGCAVVEAVAKGRAGEGETCELSSAAKRASRLDDSPGRVRATRREAEMARDPPGNATLGPAPTDMS